MLFQVLDSWTRGAIGAGSPAILGKTPRTGGFATPPYDGFAFVTGWLHTTQLKRVARYLHRELSAVPKNWDVAQVGAVPSEYCCSREQINMENVANRRRLFVIGWNAVVSPDPAGARKTERFKDAAIKCLRTSDQASQGRRLKAFCRFLCLPILNFFVASSVMSKQHALFLVGTRAGIVPMGLGGILRRIVATVAESNANTKGSD